MLIVAGETLMFLKSKIEIRALTCYPYKAGGVICTSLPLKCLGVSQRMPLTITCAVYCLQIFAYVKRKKNDQINVTTSCTELLYYLRYKNRDISSIGHFHDLVTSYRINNAGTQVTQWNFQTKGTRTSSARLSLACRTGVFFCEFFCEQRQQCGESEASAKHVSRARGERKKINACDDVFAHLSSLATRVSRSQFGFFQNENISGKEILISIFSLTDDLSFFYNASDRKDMISIIASRTLRSSRC